MYELAFNGADILALFALPVALWFLVRPRRGGAK